MSKTFSHAGVSRLNGSFKVRYANDAMRVKVLAKGGHKDIDLIELTHPMNKEDAVAFLMSIDFATRDGVTNQEVLAALTAEVDRLGEKAVAAAKPRVERSAKTKAEKTKAEKPTLAKIKARGTTVPKSTVTRAEVEAQLNTRQDTATDLEEAPF